MKVTMLNELIHFYVHRLPGSSRTQIVKLLYLTDPESRRYRGVPVTDLNWIFDSHGPFDSAILGAFDDLVEHGHILREPSQHSTASLEHRYCTPRESSFQFHSADQAILSLVVEQFGRLGLRQLLFEVINQSKPMLKAIRSEPLDMNCVNNESGIGGVGLEEACEGYQEALLGKTVSSEEAFRRARQA